MDYSHYALLEAANMELSALFIHNIKRMCPEMAIKRLSNLLCSNHTGVDFISIVAQFNSLAAHQTCAD